MRVCSFSYDDKDNTWEPEENLDCPSLIKAYEADKAAKEKEKTSKKRKAEDTPKRKDDKKIHGFDRGLEPEKIIGATDSSGYKVFLYYFAIHFIKVKVHVVSLI